MQPRPRSPTKNNYAQTESAAGALFVQNYTVGKKLTHGCLDIGIFERMNVWA